MRTLVHHQPPEIRSTWNLRAWKSAWDGNLAWDPVGTVNGSVVDFQLPDVSDPRVLAFKYRSTSTQTAWEPDDYNRHIVQREAAEVWTFAYSPRILYQDPSPRGVSYRAGDVLTLHVVTAKPFRGG